ncbi:MAG TPA: HIT family protein [Lachnospiraceae bacterium]|nr:HIT family protein [Lachnospiraceae bacterium]
MDQNCAYCMKGELVEKFGYEICELPSSTVYLFKEQSHPGRCIVASRHHVSELIELSEEEQQAFLKDVVRTAQAIHDAFHPDKVNYGMYGDTGHHLHMHLVPKYKDEYEWGGVFLMDPDRKKITDKDELEETASKLRRLLTV